MFVSGATVCVLERSKTNQLGTPIVRMPHLIRLTECGVIAFNCQQQSGKSLRISESRFVKDNETPVHIV